MEVRIQGITDRRKLVYREAVSSDLGDIKVMCAGSLGGRDVLPARYLHYLRDPLRKLYVAEYEGKVVALAGIRIIDGGHTAEGQSANGVPNITGVFYSLRDHMMRSWLLTKYPHIKLLRGTMRNEQALRDSSHGTQLPWSARVIAELAWKVPASTLTQAMAIYQTKFQSKLQCSESVGRADKGDVRGMFADTAFQEKYLPSGVVVVDSSPLGLSYRENVELVVNDGREIFLSYDEQNQLKAMSFGTAVEMGVPMETLRYVVDYYGVTDMNTVRDHTMKHISVIPALLEQSQTAKDVYIALFLPEDQFEQTFVQLFTEFLSVKLGVGNVRPESTSDRQFVVNVEIPPKYTPKL